MEWWDRHSCLSNSGAGTAPNEIWDWKDFAMDNSVNGLGVVEELRDRILASERCVVMVVGGSDTGKTTLVERLADLLAPSGSVAVVDADMGQSHIGPPTTVGWGLVKEKFPGWDAIEPEDFYFVGATSPYRNLLPAVVGAKLMCDVARSRARFVLVDTTGLVAGSVGCILKWSKIDAVRPDIVLAVQRSDELEPVLAPYTHARLPLIIRMRAPEAAVSKSVNQRTAHRERMFARYFGNSGLAELAADRVSLRCTDTLPKPRLHNLINRLVSLRDPAGRDIALSILVERDADNDSFLVRTPLKTVENVSTIVVGNLRISPDGKRLGT